MIKFKKNVAGFTLLELLVTITIIGILTAIIFTMSSQEEKTSLLRKTGYLLMQDIREMQNVAMSARGINCGTSDTNIFGIHFDKIGSAWSTSYILFADCNKNNQYKPITDSDVIFRAVGIKPDIEVSDITLSSGTISNSFDLIFMPPDPIVAITGDNTATSSREASIVLRLKKDISKIVTIKINTVGRIQME